MEKITIELCYCEETLLSEIGNRAMRRKDVALTYASAIKQESEVIDWKKVNEAIINRWSHYALDWINRKAWQLYEGKITAEQLMA